MGHKYQMHHIPFQIQQRHGNVSIFGKCYFVDSHVCKTEAFDDDTVTPILGNNPLVVLVHQWSKLGGESCLMNGIASHLTSIHGISTAVFDLRGVGLSTGRCTFTGYNEIEDVVAVCTWAVKTLSAKNIFVLGSSAGAPIAGSAIDKADEIRGFIGIGYVFGFVTSIIFGGHYGAILKTKKPKLFIHGDCDGFTSTKKFNHYFDKMNEPKHKVVIPNVGHFEMEGPNYDKFVAEHVAQFINQYNL